MPHPRGYPRPMDPAVIEAEALKLPEIERAILVDHLQASLSRSRIPYLQEHLEESRTRYSAYERGETEALDGPDFVTSLRSKFGR